MIESVVKLAFMYIITRTFVELAFPAGRHFLKYIYWSALLMIIYIAVAPVVSKVASDIHEVAVVYTGTRQAMNEVLGNNPNAQKADTGYRDIWEIGGATFRWPVKGEITQGYSDTNHGIDIASKEGDFINTARPGKVKKIMNDDIYGLAVIIDHGNGWETLYAHCSKVLAKEGGTILKGEVIALVGSTGNSNGPHLHFEIRKDGVTKNPADFL